LLQRGWVAFGHSTGSLRIEVLLVEQPFEPGRVLADFAQRRGVATSHLELQLIQMSNTGTGCGELANPASTSGSLLEFASALVPAAASNPFSVLQLTLNFINKLVELLSAVLSLS